MKQKILIINLLLLLLLFTNISLLAQEYQWFETDYEFEDIKLPANKLSDLAGEDNAMTIPAPIGNFTFYGTDFSTVRIAVDGAVTFDNSGTITSENTELPNINTQKLLIAPYWNDLSNVETYNNVYYHKNSERTIIQWDSLQISDQNGHITMQVVINPTENSIQINYRTIFAANIEDTYFATVGIQNTDGTEGIQLAYNDDFTDGFVLESEKSYKIMIPPAYPPQMSPTSGTFASETDVTITTITPDATIYYTTDGTQPTINSTEYTNPISISENTELKAIAVKNDYVSTVTTELYEIVTSGTAINSGDISGTWTAANSPYIILGDITIPNGQCLDIEPGTEILFSEKSKLTVNGCINANGTADNHIIFEPGYAASWWYGIEFNSPDISNSASSFNFCEFKYAWAEGETSPENNGAVFYIESWDNISISNSIFEQNIADNNGGAIYLNNSDIELLNSTFENNSSGNKGGAIYASNSTIDVYNNVFNQNEAITYGGSLYLENLNLSIIHNNTITNNFVSNNYSSGGGIYCSGTNAEITNNEIAYNQAFYEGGGVSLIGSNNIFFAYNEVHHNNTNYDYNKNIKNNKLEIFEPQIVTNKILLSNYLANKNFATLYNEDFNKFYSNNSPKFNGAGGGIAIDGGTGFVASNKIYNNQTSYKGGGIYLSGGSVNISSNFIAYNIADDSGGGMYITGSYNENLSNNSLVYNTSAQQGDALYIVNSSPNFYNSLFWYNKGDNTYGDISISNDGSIPNFYNCSNTYGIDGLDGDYMGGWTFTGEFENCNSYYPSFVYSGEEILGLQNYSLMINTGTPDVSNLYLPDNDANGNPRIANETIDIGCFEFQETQNINIIGGEMNGTISQGIYYANSDIIVATDETLTIEAGTEIYFGGNNGFVVEGNIQAIGTSDNHITITTADTTSFYSMTQYTTGGWKHIAFLTPDEDSRFEFVDFSYSKLNNLYLDDFEDNAGGVAIMINASPIFSNCTFDRNFTYGAGGALAYFNSEFKGGKIENCLFSNNVAISNYYMFNGQGGRGGAIFIENSSPKITNNLIIGNQGLQGAGSYGIGGAIYAINTQSNFVNNTFANNYSPNGGAFYCAQSSEISMLNEPVFVNNIFWDNHADEPIYGNQIRLDGPTNNIIFLNNDIEGGLPQIITGDDDQFYGQYTNNINSNPNFVANLSNYSLQQNSPCIDAGLSDMSSFNIPNLDIAGNTRINNSIIEIGAYEYQQIVNIQDIANDDFLVYPNPSKGIITVECKQLIVKNIEIIDVSGKIIFSNQYPAINNQYSIEKKGIYFIKIKTDNEFYTKKLIIQ